SIRLLHQFIEVERAAVFRPHFAKLDHIPSVHPIHLITFLPDSYRFARDQAMDDFFVFGPRPASHSAATPINGTPNVVICIGALLKVEKSAGVSGTNRPDAF